ncbi:NAD(P)-binding protein [Fistulina hepatica ATCC 64428]|uniref:NAD(P)-binding protein n=1 Tax=Fistulina hepatica ATCC 64428 TaxID=1128425 RepID=A0A0D7AJL2_9AGAR|nr:NAD(P)-binding protein [Fistulina hepatica ATCC 64428]
MSTSNASKPAYPTLADKIAIVTGASRGIGAAIAYELASHGASVMLTYTSTSSEASAAALVDKIHVLNNGARAAIVRADAGSLEAPKEIVNATLAAFNTDHVDILANNAAIFEQKLGTDVTPAEFARSFEVNERGVFFLMQAVAQVFCASGGRIINITAGAARLGIPGYSVYSGTKAAVEGFTRVWAAELGSKGHTVNVVAPGPVETGMLSENTSEEFLKGLQERTPMENRIGHPEDLAGVVVLLCGDGARWITGQTISASGGLLMQ